MIVSESFIKHEDIRIFTPNEFVLLICGVSDINAENLRRNAQFEESYNLETPVVKIFFNVIKEWDKVSLSKLLGFITVSSQILFSRFKFYMDKKFHLKLYQEEAVEIFINTTRNPTLFIYLNTMMMMSLLRKIYSLLIILILLNWINFDYFKKNNTTISSYNLNITN